ncbi:MAG: hypothetical protein II558_07885 [Treponema sp.]|nr:hypothetical protein [Treponema sp.]MBQ2548811.1 hypothetical protein [Treponema sp.]MBQ4025689.1 hypothetical protein [Treponema sp.]
MGQKLPDWLGKRRTYNSNFGDVEKEIIKWEVLSIQKKQLVKVRFISVNSENRQGIRIAIDAGKGTLTINGVSGRAFELWEEDCPKEFEIECSSDEGYLSIYNIFERNEQGLMRKYSQMDFSGMILEQSGNIYRYSCNDTGRNTNFDKLVFEIELLN